MPRALIAAVALLALGDAGLRGHGGDAVLREAGAAEIGLAETGREQVSERVLALTLDSKAMNREMDVRVLLPQGYDEARRYPVLYLFHGSFGQEGDWLELGDAERIVGDRELIVVMADGGLASSFSDWYGIVAGQEAGPQNWESFHVDELVPYVDATFPTLADPSNRFIAGLSSGGHGAFKYAARTPACSEQRVSSRAPWTRRSAIRSTRP